MIIIYNSKTGFTKKYAEILASQTGLSLYSAHQLPSITEGTPTIFLGWISAGRIQGLKKVIEKYNVKAVCACGTGRKAEPDEQTIIKNNKIEEIPFFYLRGGCLPLGELKGRDKIAMSFFLKILKGKKDQSDSIVEAIQNIEMGCDYVREERIATVIEWVKHSL